MSTSAAGRAIAGCALAVERPQHQRSSRLIRMTRSVSSTFDRAISVVLTIAVMVFVASYVRRSWSTPAPQRPSGPAMVFDRRWQSLLPLGHQRGEGAGVVDIIEFGDFECPFCRSFDVRLRRLEEKYQGKIRRTFVHLPIPSHRFAYHAARLAECAASQGRFWPMHDALFARQDSFGLRPWITFARDAGIDNEGAFERCTASASPVDAIEVGLRMGREFEVAATPTVFMNGWRLAVAPQDDEALSSLVGQFLSGTRELRVAGQRFSRDRESERH